MSGEAPLGDGSEDLEGMGCGTPFVSPGWPGLSGDVTGPLGAGPFPPGSSRSVLEAANAALGGSDVGWGVELIPLHLRGDRSGGLLQDGRVAGFDRRHVAFEQLPDGSVRVRNTGARPCLLAAGQDLAGMLPPERLPWHGMAPWLRGDVLVGAGDEVVVPAALVARGLDWIPEFPGLPVDVEAPLDALESSVEHVIDEGPRPGQHGVVFALGPRVLSVEVFGSPELLAAEWEPTIRRALQWKGNVWQLRPGLGMGSVVRFLDSLASAPAISVDAVGLGTQLEVAMRETVGRVLELDGRLVHATARIPPE